MKTVKLALALACLGPAAMAHAGDYTFGDVSINQLNWSDATLDRTEKSPYGTKRNFQYLELEGGAGRAWGDVYGFFDLENWNRSDADVQAGDRRYTTKLIARFDLGRVGGVPVKLYTHVYDTRGSGQQFYDQNRVLGLGTDFSAGRFWIKPFIGAHQELKQNVGAHMNGWMAGYVLGYDFSLFGQPFSVTQWHETEFNRSDYFSTMAQPGGEAKRRTGQNGAIGLWWTPVKTITTGIQYRYAVNKLGIAGNEHAMIYSLKVNF